MTRSITISRSHVVHRVAFALGVAVAVAAGPAHADDEADARTHFAAGINLLQDPARPRYDEAYVEFKKAYALARSPKILGNIALCAMKLERDAEAIQAYMQYLHDVPDLSSEERAQVERDVATLNATLATVTLTSRPPGAYVHDTRIAAAQTGSITNVYGPVADRTDIRLRRGHHVIKARLEDGREVIWESEIAGGESHVFEFPARDAVAVVDTKTLASPSSPPPDRRVTPAFYVAGGLTVAAGVGSLVTGLLAVDTHSRFDRKNDGDDPAAADDLRKTGTTLNIVSDVLLVAAIVGVGVTTFLYLTRPSTTTHARLTFAPIRF